MSTSDEADVKPREPVSARAGCWRPIKGQCPHEHFGQRCLERAGHDADGRHMFAFHRAYNPDDNSILYWADDNSGLYQKG